MPNLVLFHESTQNSSGWNYSLTPNLSKLQTMETVNMTSQIDTFILSICDLAEIEEVPTPMNFENVHTLYVLYGRTAEENYIELLCDILEQCKNLKRFAVVEDHGELLTLRELDEIEKRQYVGLNGILDQLPWVPTHLEVRILLEFGDSDELRKEIALGMFQDSRKAPHLYRQSYVDIEVETMTKILAAIENGSVTFV